MDFRNAMLWSEKSSKSLDVGNVATAVAVLLDDFLAAPLLPEPLLFGAVPPCCVVQRSQV